MAPGSTMFISSLPAVQAENTAQLVQPAVDRADARVGIQVERHRRGQRDQQDLGQLADPEPD